MDSKKIPSNDDETTSIGSIPLEQNQTKIDLPIEADIPQLSRPELNDFIEKEAKMIKRDKMEKEKADAKNAVEEYVYDMRGKISDIYENFVNPEERENFRKLLCSTEDWLYDKGADEQKSVYAKELAELQKIGDPIVFRYTEWEKRSLVMNEFGRSLQVARKALDSYAANEEKYSHITTEEMSQVEKLWQEKNQWFEVHIGLFAKLGQHEDPPISSEQIIIEREEFENKLRPILNKPKPKVSSSAVNQPAATSGDNEYRKSSTHSRPSEEQPISRAHGNLSDL